jgi:hypothetical protein
MTEPIREENVTQDGGVKKIVLKEGTGETPTPSSNVVGSFARVISRVII